ncbi:MAG: DNA polymerase III subunit gamma/tau [Buchnera aphidicola (Periphyllus lyropictus)]|uniref:DNA polymerase III subunit gamma/tau n=1 Tax=Buchnera aphidicola TaxID=9 RepID=UPI001ECD5A9F|nr:DNA polymerase III subunit gamma/tau [Buchnera aphidicola]NIH16510.1 DNA polymerase III subunit gamma/tau [Buchnera aphidicola (Periphyllus lyropictus)]USS94821.1 DNA polymerase III subunit gamma/tau [Buchnera aphidicola (Periphyllus lyropictus)]
MKYQVFARKWRPRNFKEVIGQKYVIKALSNSLKLNKIHQAWIFHGTRGIGKTTIARILAKCLNCKKKITNIPCRKCNSCKEIEKNFNPDLIEIDAASKTKVEDIKELLENAKYPPIKERFKIYLIDEVHMLSRYSFNALLKTLEEPPKHVKFILATTNIEKLPKTIISRCIKLSLKTINYKKINNQLKYILKKEKIYFEKKTTKMLSQASDGSMRDALSLTEQAISIGNNKIIKKDVKKMLGIFKYENFINLLISLFRKDIKKILFLKNHILSLDVEPEQILIELLKLLHYLHILKIFSIKWKSIKYNSKQKKILKRIAKENDFLKIKKYYSIILKGRKNISFSPSKKLGMELTLLQTLEIK